MSDLYSSQQLLANQFCEDNNFAIWLAEKARSYDNAADWLIYLQENLDVYIAKGHWLDLIGAIVGQGRVVDQAIPIVFFGFESTPSALGFGEARFWDGSEPTADASILTDPEYRLVILARIAFNYANVSFVGLAESLSIMFQTDQITLENITPAKCRITMGIVIGVNELALIEALDLLPLAAGIEYEFITP